MKRIILTIALVGLASLSLAQEKEKVIEKYKDFKPCIECFDDWKKTNPNSSSSQSNILAQNKLAQQGSNQLRAFGRIVVGIVASALTLAIINKTTAITNNAVK